ncbi:hypothetical protein [Bacteroides ovatus]|nr:hypothetical protein [Bacteroides ovatus]MDC2622118.1 hypothetical protein [Bacteroides ovatus]MDC2636050.1 hypothetical protein [Bacteroides ovatus]MDC2651321.1 hypothetical protein [Bacteroides ovatus]
MKQRYDNTLTTCRIAPDYTGLRRTTPDYAGLKRIIPEYVEICRNM